MSATPEPATSRGAFVLLGWIVEPEAGQLHRDGETVRLEPKVMAVLTHLAERPGRVVSRDALLDAVWPDVVVTESAVNRCISELRRVFGDDPKAPRVIETIPKRGYRLLTPVTPLRTPGDGTIDVPTLIVPEAHPVVRPAHDGRRRRGLVLAAALAASVLVGFLVLLGQRDRGAASPQVFGPLTSLPGTERDPALSPDGERVAFVWRAPGAASYDLYTQMLGTATPVVLTETAAHERFPAWSPDGQWLAFARIEAGDCGIYRMTALGTAERKLAACASVAGLSWSSDGAWLAFGEYDRVAETSKIVLLSVETLERRVLTDSEPGTRGDFYPAFAPDGRSVAHVQGGERYGVARVVETSLDDGTPVPRTPWLGEVWGIAWDGLSEDLFVAAEHDGVAGLWRARGAGHLDRVPLSASGATSGVTASAGRIAVEAWTYDTDLVSIGSDAPFAATLLTSTHADEQPALSPDGERVAFISSRSGAPALWIGTSGGDLMRPLQNLGAGEYAQAPSWSPDGEWLVYELHTSEGVDLYMVPSAGGRAQRITRHPAADVAPSFSRDGRWIYFGSMRSGAWQIWKVPVDGGEAAPVTDAGGYRALESIDGRSVYVVRYGEEGVWEHRAGDPGSGLRVAPLGIADWGNWEVTEQGLLTLSREQEGARVVLWQVGVEPQEIARVGGPQRRGRRSFAASHDGRVMLVTHVRGRESDLLFGEVSVP